MDGWIQSHTHRDCQAALDTLAALVRTERTQHRATAVDQVTGILRDICEQRARAYCLDKTNVETRAAVAAELRQFAIDAEHILRRRGTEGGTR